MIVNEDEEKLLSVRFLASIYLQTIKYYLLTDIMQYDMDNNRNSKIMSW